MTVFVIMRATSSGTWQEVVGLRLTQAGAEKRVAECRENDPKRNYWFMRMEAE